MCSIDTQSSLQFLLQAAAGQSPEVKPGEQDSYLLQTEAVLTESTRVTETAEAEDEQEEEDAEAVPAGYVSRRKTDPYMQKKLRSLQVGLALDKPKFSLKCQVFQSE